jgi:hypothetical protein
MSDPGATVRCSCGERITSEQRTATLTCGCGAMYAVTVTQITPSRERPWSDPESGSGPAATER